MTGPVLRKRSSTSKRATRPSTTARTLDPTRTSIAGPRMGTPDRSMSIHPCARSEESGAASRTRSSGARDIGFSRGGSAGRCAGAGELHKRKARRNRRAVPRFESGMELRLEGHLGRDEAAGLGGVPELAVLIVAPAVREVGRGDRAGGQVAGGP